MKFRKREEEELEMLLGEIPNPAPSLLQYQYHLHHNSPHVLGTTSSCDVTNAAFGSPGGTRNPRLWSEGTSSSSPAAESPSLPRGEFPAVAAAAAEPHCLNGFPAPEESQWPDPFIGLDECALSDKLGGLLISDESAEFNRFGPWGTTADPYGFQLDGRARNVVAGDQFEEGGCGSSNGHGGFWQLERLKSVFLDQEMMELFKRRYHRGNSMGPSISTCRLDAPSLNFQWNSDIEQQGSGALGGLEFEGKIASRRDYFHRGIRVSNAAHGINRESFLDTVSHSRQMQSDYYSDGSDTRSFSSSHRIVPNLPFARGTPHYGFLMSKDRIGAIPDGWPPQPPQPKRNIEGISCEDSFIIQGKDLSFVVNDRYCNLRESRRLPHNALGRGSLREKDFDLVKTGCSPRMHCPALVLPKYSSLDEVEGYIYYIAKDQHGCRFLQRKFEEGTPDDVQMIFNEILNHVVELMMNSFGNCLIQKLLDVCTEQQRTQVLIVTSEPGKLVKISLNTHGTRVVQKLIETLKTEEQVSLMVSALAPGFLDLIKDLNGNHVIQRCLQCLSNVDNKFIFYGAAKYCVDIATHQHGCCVLQCCIAHSTGEYREKLVAEISSNALLLAQDPYGNYVVQYILELKIPSTTKHIISQFEGNYVSLSTQKFSSNVVEKCLLLFGEESQSRIIHELLATSRFEQLLQDPYANYVIQSALTVSKGPLHASLVESIRPFAPILRTSPHCKRIFSRAFLKK